MSRDEDFYLLKTFLGALKMNKLVSVLLSLFISGTVYLNLNLAFSVGDDNFIEGSWSETAISTCGKCAKSWSKVEPHFTQYDEHQTCFSLCEKCWEKLTIKERVPFYETLHIQKQHDSQLDAEKTEHDWALIVRAVLAGE